MRNARAKLNRLMRDNPSIILAHFDDPSHPRTLTILHNNQANHAPLNMSRELSALELHISDTEELHTMIADQSYEANPVSGFQACQDPPIKLGCQIQPAGANWVGTAGCPAKWRTGDRDVYGLLTNWHVIASGNETVGRRVHQPTTDRAPIAFLDRWLTVQPSQMNTVDAAVADAEVAGNHSISPKILDVGALQYPPVAARIDVEAVKCGRTTGYTSGVCAAVGASARVNYGAFIATFEDQDVYISDQGTFSAPGDSGSLIINALSLRPMSLLFAGGGGITIANPMRHVTAALDLLFPFP